MLNIFLPYIHSPHFSFLFKISFKFKSWFFLKIQQFLTIIQFFSFDFSEVSFSIFSFFLVNFLLHSFPSPFSFKISRFLISLFFLRTEYFFLLFYVSFTLKLVLSSLSIHQPLRGDLLICVRRRLTPPGQLKLSLAAAAATNAIGVEHLMC